MPESNSCHDPQRSIEGRWPIPSGAAILFISHLNRSIITDPARPFKNFATKPSSRSYSQASSSHLLYLTKSPTLDQFGDHHTGELTNDNSQETLAIECNQGIPRAGILWPPGAAVQYSDRAHANYCKRSNDARQGDAAQKFDRQLKVPIDAERHCNSQE